MRKYLIKRLLQIVLTLYIFATLVFFLVHAQPGDISDVYLSNPNIPAEARESLQERLGLNQPIHLQYLSFMENLVTGDLGVSYTQYPRPVADIIMERLPRTLALFAIATIIYFGLGFQLGKFISWKRGQIADHATTIFGVIMWTVYVPWFGLLLIYIFGFKLGWVPMGKFLDPLLWRQYEIDANTVFGNILLVSTIAAVTFTSVYTLSRRLTNVRLHRNLINFTVAGGIVAVCGYLLSSSTMGLLASDILRHMILPTVTLIFIGFGGYMLLMRDSMVEIVKEDYVLAARAKGLPEKQIRDRHAARNALLPLVTAFVLAMVFAVDGSIVIETIFDWPGIGLTLLNAVLNEDTPLAMGAFIFVGIFALIAHFIVDILYAYLDPRIRYG